ncbi:MAG: ABC transporter substrate-binding protein, partial [Chloroflexota bacterium]|nr:ABC transporter substrate-binding protein [Chloroflexota bacterium]
AERETVQKESPRIIVKQGPSPLAQYFIPNVTRKPWDDIRVRKAVYLAFDRQGAVAVPGHNDASVGADLVPGSGWDIPVQELLQMPGYRQPKDQDIAEAKRQLAEAGYPKGFSFDLLTRNIPDIVEQAVFAKDQMARLGIDAKLKIQETGLFYVIEAQHDFDALSHGVGYVSPDPDFVFGEQYVTGAGGNWGLWSNTKFDALYREQSLTADAAQRKKLARQMQELIMQDASRIILYYRNLSSLYWPEVRDWYFTPSYYVNRKMQDVWLAE